MEENVDQNNSEYGHFLRSEGSDMLQCPFQNWGSWMGLREYISVEPSPISNTTSAGF